MLFPFPYPCVMVLVVIPEITVMTEPHMHVDHTHNRPDIRVLLWLCNVSNAVLTFYCLGRRLPWYKLAFTHAKYLPR